MKLHWHPFSIFPRRVQIVLREKGLAYDDVLVDLPGGGQRSAAFLRLNPFGQVPVLEDGDLALSESIAILEYVEERHPTPPLMPPDAARRALVRQLMLWSGDYLAPPWKAWMQSQFAGVPTDDPAVLRGRADVGTHLDVLEGRLGRGPWLTGEYSLADVCYAPFVTTFALTGLADLLDGRPAVRAWVDRLAQRPAVRDTAPGTG